MTCYAKSVGVPGWAGVPSNMCFVIYLGHVCYNIHSYFYNI